MSLMLMFAALLCAATHVHVPSARASATPGDSSAAHPRLRLFLDSPDAELDFDFLRRELPWVDWVRDRADADVRLLVAFRETGSGGSEGTLFVERARGGPVADTVRVYVAATATEDEERRQFVRTIAAILARDLAERPEAAHLEVRLARASGPAPGTPVRDRWNHWVYRLATNGYTSGEDSYRSLYLYSSLGASRVTERHKLGVAVSQNYNESRYELGDGDVLYASTRSWSARGLFTHALSARWSAGVGAEASASNWSNVRSTGGIGPALEFDVFPYAQSSSRAITFGAHVFVSRTRYEELTLYDKTEETLVRSEFEAALGMRKPWGSLNGSCSVGYYLHDTSKYRVTAHGSASLKVWRGFSLELYAWGARTHDQLALPRGDATDTEVLTRQRQLATGYQYNASIGFGYRFGSIFDNVVNDRLENLLGTI